MMRRAVVLKRIGKGFGLLMSIGVLAMMLAAPVAAAGLVARVMGGGIQFDGNGFYPGELVQINGIHYDGSTLPFGPATANAAGAITGVVPYADTALYQIDARGYASGMHAVSNITGALPYPVVPPGYPYVTPTFPDYTICTPGPLPINGGYANTGFPFTGAPYGGIYPGPGFGYPSPPSGVVLYPYLNACNGGVIGAPTFGPTTPVTLIGVPVVFTGNGWTPGAAVIIGATAPDGMNEPPATLTAGNDGTVTGSLTFSVPGTWHVYAQANGTPNPVSATIQVNAQ
ncbi:MAG: hypothetical protein LC793_15000 [Thermomicrobia bacterium]|nr:hypothetical protein [Thermomicrobia bacterium]